VIPSVSAISAPQWEIETHQWATEKIIEDSNKFLNFYGKASNFWSFN
jgi:hypothetical protein